MDAQHFVRNVYQQAPSVVEALALDMLEGTDPEAPLTRVTLAEQQTLTVAAFLLLKTVIMDTLEARQVCPGCYLRELGLRVASTLVELGK